MVLGSKPANLTEPRWRKGRPLHQPDGDAASDHGRHLSSVVWYFYHRKQISGE